MVILSGEVRTHILSCRFLSLQECLVYFSTVNLRMALIVAFMKKYYDIFTLLLQAGGPSDS